MGPSPKDQPISNPISGAGSQSALLLVFAVGQESQSFLRQKATLYRLIAHSAPKMTSIFVDPILCFLCLSCTLWARICVRFAKQILTATAVHPIYLFIKSYSNNKKTAKIAVFWCFLVILYVFCQKHCFKLFVSLKQIFKSSFVNNLPVV